MFTLLRTQKRKKRSGKKLRKGRKGINAEKQTVTTVLFFKDLRAVMPCNVVSINVAVDKTTSS
jgi:hypothetical protein